MKTLTYLSLVTISVWVFSCQSQSTDSSSDNSTQAVTVSTAEYSTTEQEIIDAELQFKKALRSADVGTLNTILTDDYREITWAGSVQDKQWLLDGVESMYGDLDDDAKPTLIEPEILIHGDAATLIYLMKSDGESLDKKETFYTRVLTNFIKEEEDWKKWIAIRKRT